MAEQRTDRGGPIARRMPRTLAAAAHVTAFACWVFVLGAFIFKMALESEGFTVIVVFLFLLAPIVLPAMLVALAVAGLGMAITLPLAISWLRTPNREGDGGFALAHVAFALLVGGYVLLRITMAS